jgi:alpha-D-xyloside xylohydrolase
MTALKQIAAAGLLCFAIATVSAMPPLLNDPVDVSGDFHAPENFYFLADKVSGFDPVTHSGTILYQRAQYRVRHAFNNDLALITAVGPNEFPDQQYAANPSLPFSLDFLSPRTIRLRLTSGPQVHPPQEELMLAGELPHDDSWKYEKIAAGHRYSSAAGSVTIVENPFHIELRGPDGKLLTATDHSEDNKSTFSPVLPFGFVRRTKAGYRSPARQSRVANLCR